jgi:hypothetical protein
MKIGIFGNINNYPYTLALGLRRIGVDAVLVVNRKERLHRPEAKDPSLATSYPQWILDCSDLDEDAFVTESPRIGAVLNYLSHQASGLILNDLGPSLLEAAGIPGISLLTGSDLSYYASYDSDEIRSSVWDPAFAASAGGRLGRRKWREFITRQRNGILRSRAVSFAVPGLMQEGDALLREIGVPDECRLSVYLADTVDLAPVAPRLRERLRLFNGARLNWKKPFPAGFSAQDDKRTDILLEGFAGFLHAGGRGTLVLVQKGLHVAETKELAKSLGIAGNIEWQEEMTLAAFYEQVREADVVCDQLGPSFPGMAGLDAMAIGRPVIANFRLDVLGPCFGAPWPVCHVESVRDVRDALLKLQRSPEKRASLGSEARAFAERHLSPEVNAARCLEKLELRSRSLRPGMLESVVTWTGLRKGVS